MRFLAGVIVAGVMAASGYAMAQASVPGTAGPENALAMNDDGVSRGLRDSSTVRDPLEEEARSQRKKNAFLYVVAAGLAAIGTTYTLTRKYGDEEEE